MLKIILPPKTTESLYTLPEQKWEDKIISLYTLPEQKWEDEPISFSDFGIYLEYSEDDFIKFQFYYVLGRVTILKGPWSEQFEVKEMNNFFDTQVKLSELWEWLDNEISFDVIKKLSPSDNSIKNIWKINTIIDISKIRDSEKKTELIENYLEFNVSTVIVRCMPYSCWSDNFINMEVLNNDNKIYWITLCLLKYLRM